PGLIGLLYISCLTVSTRGWTSRNHVAPRVPGRPRNRSMSTGTAQQMFVGGDWLPSATGETFDAVSPATGEGIGTVPQGDRDDAGGATAAAGGAADGGAGLTAFERAAKMHWVGDLIESRRDQLAYTLTLDQGKPLRAEAFDEVDELVEYWRMAAE